MKRALIMLAIMSCFIVALFGLSGCVFSETITERIYYSSPDSQIDESLDPILINSIDATTTTDKLPKLETQKSETQQDREEEIPEVAEEPPEPTTPPAASPQYDGTADDRGTSESGQGESTDDDDAANDGSESDSNPADGEKPDDPKPSDDDSDDPKPADDDDPDDPKPDDEDKPSDGPDDGDEGNGRKSGGSGDYYGDGMDYDDPEIPENINEVVAFGNNAVIVSIIGGNSSSSALIGCDTATKEKTASVLENRGMGAVKTIDYVEGTMMSDAAFNTLAYDIVPDLVYFTEGKNPFNDEQMEELAKEHISLYPLPTLTSETRIRFAFQVIGRTLDKGGVSGSSSNMQGYLDYCDELVGRYTSANGGLTGGFDYESGVEQETGADEIMALYVDKWNENARFSDPYDYLDSSSGVALATLGYGTSPLNYYWSVGGVINNAARGKLRDRSGTGIVWQISTEMCKFNFGRWNGSIASVDLSEYLSTGGAFSASLLSYSLNTRYGVGTDVFPAVVARDQHIADLLKEASDEPHDLYYPYPTIYPADGTNVGYFVDASESMYIETCVGRTPSNESVLVGSSLPVYVNPKGLCQSATDDPLCSWADGSPESILEASWIYYRFRGGSEADFDSEVRNFYQKFYGYALDGSELDAIKAGTLE